MSNWKQVERLFHEVMLEHSNPQSTNYRHCDETACTWCSNASIALANHILACSKGGSKSRRTLSTKEAQDMAAKSAIARKPKLEESTTK